MEEPTTAENFTAEANTIHDTAMPPRAGKAGTSGGDIAINVPPDNPDKSKTKSASKGGSGSQGGALQLGRNQREAEVKDFVRIFSYSVKWDWFLLGSASLASIGAGVTLPLMNVVFGRLAGNFSSFGQTESDPNVFRRHVNQQALYMLILFIVRFVLTYVKIFGFRIFSIRMTSAMRLHYLRCVFGQTIHVLDSMPAGAAASTITSTANTLQLGISENLGTFIEFLAALICALVVAFSHSWLLTLVVSSVLGYILIVVGTLFPFIVRAESSISRSEVVANSIASESFSSIRMLMACGAEFKMVRRFDDWVSKAQRYGQRSAPFLATVFGSIFFSLHSAFALAFWYGTKAYSEGRIHSVSTVIIVMLSLFTTLISVERISSPLIAASKSMVAAAEFFAVIDAPRPDLGHLTDPDVSATEDIVFKDVDFAYPSRPHVKVLHGLNLNIRAGKVNAIVGPSGCGKSTIIGLVERWYSLQNDQYTISKTIDKAAEKKKKKEEEKERKMDEADRKKEEKRNQKKNKSGKDTAGDGTTAKEKAPAGLPAPLLGDQDNDLDLPPVELKGSITTAGHDLDDIQVKWWRSQIGLVQQEPFLFNDTIFNNVAFGLIGSAYEDASDSKKRELVEEACTEAFADEFINRLPDGYQTRVGESGAKLSGGQRQRIAIARSIAKKPKILMLDEATSAVDVHSERIVQAALDKVSRNRTTITVAHRLSTIKSADHIFVIKHGQCVEQGTHTSLLEDKEGVYYGLVHAQQLSLGAEDDHDDGIQSLPIAEEDAILAEDEETKARKGTRTKASGAGQPSVAVAAAETRDEETAAGGLGDDSKRAGSFTANTPDAEKDGIWKDKGFFTGFGRLLYEQRAWFPLYAVMVGASMGAAASSPLQAFVFAKLVVVFGSFEVLGDVADIPADVLNNSQPLRDARFYSLMYFVLALGTGGSYFVLSYACSHVEHFIAATYKKQYFSGIIHHRADFFDHEDHSTGTLLSRVSGDSKQLRELLGINLAMGTIAVFTVVGAICISYPFAWKLALVSMCVIIPVMLGSTFFRMRYEMDFVDMNARVFDESSKWAAESIGAFRTVSALTLEEIICMRYDRLLSDHTHEAFMKARFQVIIVAWCSSINLGCQALINWYGGHLVANGEYTVTAFFVCYMAIVHGSESAGQALAFIPNAAQATQSANRILHARETENKDRIPLGERIPETDTEADTAHGGNRGVKIELRDVHFRYPTRDMPIFTRLNLTIERGQFAAIVGASGSGKTSIVSLLERFYDVQGGAVLCNGRDIRDVNIRTYRKLLSLVAQEPTLFQGTIRENVMLGVKEPGMLPESADDIVATEDDMVQACRDAAIHDFVASLPDGYDTVLGSKGVSLSGGQKQRIAVARALLRNPRILLLDEATSSLDSDTEKLIQATFERVAKGRTTVAVAHRLSTIQRADVIFVLGHGGLLEQGSHAELLKKRGTYWQMCQSQALDR